MIGLGLFELLLVAVIGAFALASLGFWIWMLVDCAQAPEKPGSNDRLVWILVIVLTGFIGALIYFFAIRMPRRSVERDSRGPGVTPTRPPAPPLR